jgi:hypothetical protein
VAGGWWLVAGGWWLVALNLPKAQLDLGMPVELWSVDPQAVAEKAASEGSGINY